MERDECVVVEPVSCRSYAGCLAMKALGLGVHICSECHGQVYVNPPQKPRDPTEIVIKDEPRKKRS